MRQRVSEMAPWLRAPDNLSEEPGSVPGIHRVADNHR